MLHKISAFCNKIDSIKKMSDDLRVLKYGTSKSNERDLRIQNLIETIQIVYLQMIKMNMKNLIMIILDQPC